MSKKNIKNNKKNTTHKNYKIEALEPRLMMDANVGLDDFENQIDNVSTAVDNCVGSISDFNLSSLGLDSSLDSASQFLTGASDAIKDQVKGIFKEYRSSLDSKVKSVDIDDLVQALNEKIGTLPSSITDLSFVKEGKDTIKVNFKYQGQPVETDKFIVSDVGLNIDGEKFSVAATADMSISLDLDKNDDDKFLNEGLGDAADDIDFTASVNNISASVPNVGVSASFMNIAVNEVDDSVQDVNATYVPGSVSSEVDLEFSVDASKSNLPFKMTSDYIGVSKAPSATSFEVDFPEVSLNNGFSLGTLVGGIDATKLPFLNNFSIPFNDGEITLDKVVDILLSFDQYWARTSVALNGIVNDAQKKLDVTKLKSCFDILCQNKLNEIGKIFNTIKLYEAANDKDFVCLYANSGLAPLSSTLTSPIGLSVDVNNPTVLTLELKPNLGDFTKEIDFNLFKLTGFNVDATLKVNVQVYLDKGALKFKEISLNDFEIKISKQFTNLGVHIGLFDAKLSGSFDYTIKADASGLKESSVVLSCDDIELKSGNVTIYKKPTGPKSLDFKFNMVESVWEFPDDLKQFFSLTGETLANNVGIYLNSLRTSLRSLVEDRVKLNFLGDSAGSLVAETIANIDKVLYGEKKIDELKNVEEYVYEGLFKVENGALVANFDSVESFKKIFNDAWLNTFKVSDVCDIKYLGNKVETADNVIFDDYAELIGSAKDTFEFDHYVLTFKLKFGIDKSIDLNLVDALGNSFANVSTYGSVSAKGEAGITFSLDVNFKHENLKPDTKLNEFWKENEAVAADKTYIESESINNFIDGKTKIAVIDPSTKTEFDSIEIDSSSLISGGCSKQGNLSKGGLEYSLEDNQIIILSKREFDLRAGDGDQQNYAELRLGASTLQTTVTKTIAVSSDVSQWKKDLILSFGSGKSLKIPHNVLSDLEGEKLIESAETDLSAKLKDLLNQYFNLQYSSDFAKELKFDFGMKNSSGSIVVGEDRTIMNTFGLYVVSVEGDVTNGFNVRFGCDEKRIREYGTPGFKGGDKLDDNGKTTYMRVSGALKTSGVVGSENGLMLEKYTLDAQNNMILSNQEYLDLGLVFAPGWVNSYSDEGVAKADLKKLSDWLDGSTNDSSLQKLKNGDKFEAVLREYEDESHNKTYFIGVVPKEVVSGFFSVRNDSLDSSCRILERYVFVNNDAVLAESKKIKLKTDYTQTYDDRDLAESKANKLLGELDLLFKDAFKVDVVGDSGSFELKIEAQKSVSDIYRSVVSDKFLTINVGSKSVHLDTSTCRDLTSLANAIKKTIENEPTKTLTSVVHSIAVNDDKIVFAVSNGTTISSSNLQFTNVSGDFGVKGVSAVVDFGNLTDAAGNAVEFKDSSTLEKIVEAVNQQLSKTGIKLQFFEDDGTGKPVVDEDNNPVYWDHLEFRSSSYFELENKGLSHILERLGFATLKATEYVKNQDYRIVGKALLGADWSKLIVFTNDADAALEVFANASLDVGQNYTAEKAVLDNLTEPKYVTYTIDGDVDFAINGLIYNGTNKCYYKIVDVSSYNTGDENNPKYKTNLKVSVFAEGAKGDKSKNLGTSKSFRYMGGAVASVGFVDVDLVASGKVGFDAKFKLTKLSNTDTADDSNVLQYKVDSTINSKTENTKPLQFEVSSFVDIGDKISQELGNASISLDKEGKLDVDGQLDNIANKAIAMFGNFTAEDFFAILDSLVERVRDIAKNTDVKIPVINKSVSDLVDIADNIRDIVTKLRNDKVFSLQAINDRLNKYLVDYHLSVPSGLTGVSNPFEIVINSASSTKELVFNINIDKAFDTVHQFSFGDNKNGGINGNADLKVTGDFWFSLSGKAVLADKSFDLKLNKAIEFGANVDIVGEKLSFNLGLDVADTNLLANLITVGSNNTNSYICAQASLMGSLGGESIGQNFSEWSQSLNPEFAMPVVVMGKLPISVCNISLGDVLLGIGNKGNKALTIPTNVQSAKSNIETILASFADYWKKLHDGDDTNDVAKPDGLIDSDTLKLDDFFKLVTDADYSNTNGKIVADFSNVYGEIKNLLNGNVGWFDKIKLAITGFNKLFDTLESSLNGGMMSHVKDVPIVGDALSGGVDFLGDLKKSVLEPLSNFLYESTGMNAEMVAQKLNELFGTYLQAVTVDQGSGDAWKPTTSGGKVTYYREGADYAEWYLSIGKDYSFGSGLGFDLGFPGLGLKSDAGVNLNLNWRLNFGFGVSQKDGFYFIFNDGSEVFVSANVDVDGKILGSLAGLGLEMTLPNNKPVSLSFGVDLDGNRSSGVKVFSAPTKYGEHQIKFSNLSLSNIEFDYNAKVDLVAGITVGIAKDLDSKVGDAPKFPNLSGQFDFHWESGNGVTALGFNKFELDMGTFISGVLGPIVSKIQKVVEPLEPLIDFLTTPFPVLDDLGFTYTPLSLAKQFSKGKFDDRMVYAVKDLIEISKKISAFGNKSLKIDLGNMVLVEDKDLHGLNSDAKKLLQGKTSASNFNVTAGYANVDPEVQRKASSALSGNGLNIGDSAWRFAWDNPTDLFKLLLGQDIMLVEYDMPKLTFSFDWSTFVRIYGPLGARIGLSLGANIDLGFGYDTLGIRQWVGSGYKDFSRLLNGFYVNDLRDGVDIAELSFHGALTAAAELNAGVSAGVGGGVGINVGFNLYDPNKDGKVRLNEITRLFSEEGLFGIFDVEGKITAKLYAYVDLLFYTKEWNITGDKTLFEFEFSHSAKPVMISSSGDGDVVANVGSNSSSRVAVGDENKTLDDGDETLVLSVNGKTVSDGYGHSETVKGKLIINAEKGSDKIVLSSNGADADFDIEINGGDGDDYIDLSKLNLAAGHYVVITGGAGADTIIGAQGLNIIFGDEGAARVDKEKDASDPTKETINGVVAEANVDANKAGGDIIIGGSKHDIIFGGAGDDQIDGGDGVDYIFGDGGRVFFKNYSSFGAVSNLSDQSFTPEVSRTDISLDGGADTLIGGKGDDVIYGGSGNDHIDGGAGEDEIYGEKGHDRIMGGSDNDTISGGEGMDVIFGDRVETDDLAKSFIVEANKLTAFSQEFRDAQFKKGTKISEDEFKIKVDEKSPLYAKYIQELKDKINKGTLTHSSDSITNDKYGDDVINGDDGNDLMFGDGGSDDKTAGGQDKIYGGIGNDIVDGDGGNDTIEGGIDNDIIYGGAGDDVINGGAGNDSLYGDNGVTDYKTKKVDSKDVVDATPLSDSSDQGGNKIVFGDNLGLHGEIYENAESKHDGGNDKITTGPGMDFVDGQGGSDKITVKLMGDNTTNYANITDSGVNGSDSLVVEGTESVDRLLLRQNEQGNLGFVALLPMDENKLDENSKNNAAITNNLNSNIERVNYTSGIDVLNVNANGGNDQIYVDGTAEKTIVDGGAGDDRFFVGQLYNSDRNNVESSANVQPIDEFYVEKTNEESYLSDGVTAGTTLSLEGGSGEDNFVALNNKGILNMSGGKDNDTFSLYSFRKDGSGDAFERGAVLVDGGKDYDTLKVRGTDAEDVFVVTKEGMLSDLVAIKAAGVESSQFDAAAGDDMFRVVANNSKDMTELYGGKGNDTFSMGGLDQDYKLRSANTDGQSVDVKYEFLTDDGLTDEQKGELDDSLIEQLKANGSLNETFTVVDSDKNAAVFIAKNVGTDAQPIYRIQESAEVFLEKEGDVASFYVGCAGLKSGESLNVTVSAPILSNKDFICGDRGFVVSEDGVNWSSSITVHPTAVNSVKIYVKALADSLVEEGCKKSIAISSELVAGTSKKVLSKSVNSVVLTFGGESRDDAKIDFEANPLVSTEEFIVGGNKTFEVKSIPKGNTTHLTFYVNGEKRDNIKYSVKDNVVTINETLSSSDVLTINVRSKTLSIDDSRVYLAFDSAKINSVCIGSSTVVQHGYSEGCSLFYELNGNVITFYNGTTKLPVTIHDKVTVSAELPDDYDWETYTDSITAAVDNNSGLLSVKAHDSALVESSGSTFNSVTYDIEFNGEIKDGKKVFVKISPTDLFANSTATKKNQRLSISCPSFATQSDGSIIVSFEESIKKLTVTVSAVADGEDDDYGFTIVHEQDEKINEIDGPVYAYGHGESMDLETSEPAMLTYKHVIDSGSGAKVTPAATFNEVNNFDSSNLFALNVVDGKIRIDISEVTDAQKSVLKAIGVDWKTNLNSPEFLNQFKHLTFKWVNEVEKNVGTAKQPVPKKETTVAATWARIESATLDTSKKYLILTFDEDVELPESGTNLGLISGNRDAIFVDEMASVDRLFVNNQKSSVDASSSLDQFEANDSNLAEGKVGKYDTHAVRFTHDELECENGITAAQMEYAEYNLGTGKDHVEINKTIYREDAFRTYTVVNTGDAKNSDAAFGISIGKSEISSDNLTNGANYITDSNVYKYDLIPAEGSEISVIKTSANTTVYYVQAEIRKLNSESESGYDVVGIQRREVLGSFSSTMGFYVKYDFILAEGEYIGEFEFFQAEFDDYIRVNSYKADAPFVDQDDSTKNGVICTGTISVAAPVEETPETPTDDSDAEGSAEGSAEETSASEEVAGIDYRYTMDSAYSGKFATNKSNYELAKAQAGERAANGYAFGLFVDATMSDGSVQRRFVSELTENTFKVTRKFTLTGDISIVSVKFAYNYTGDGQLVINAQSGNDKIDASSNDVTRNDMVVFGGLGDDYITMNKGGIAFGDRGQVKYDNGQVNGKDVHETVLGSILSEDGKTYYGDYTTGIDKRAVKDALNTPEYRLQTDGVNRDAKDIHSVDDSNGGVDMIYVGGTDSVVIGGAKGDVIAVGGDKNVVLGDNGRVIYKNATNANAVYGDELGLGLYKVETTSDNVGDVDNIVIAGNKNVAMGGDKGDSIRITGADNVAIGDAGRYTVEKDRLYAESKQESDHIGGKDYISTGDGKNAVIGGTDKDTIYTGAGNDAIIGDGGKIVMDTDRNALMMTNAGRNINKDNPDAAYEDGSAGADKIIAGNGDNIVFGGLENDSITTGSGEDVVFGDNAYATFRGNYKVAGEETDTELPTFQTGNSSEEKNISDTSILSFNFTGDSDKRITPEMEAGVESAKNWNNISGHLSGTYGNNDNEIVRFDDGTRASAISVSYGGHENHRTTSTDSRINLQGYNHWMNGNDGNTILMNSGLMTTAPNQQCGSLLEVSVDGLAQYYESYYVFVYLDIPDSHSSYKESVRKITLSTEDGKYKKSFYIDDRAGKTFSGSFVQSSNETADAAIEAVKADDPKAVENYVVFRVEKQFATDRIIIKVEDGLNPYNYNGKDLPGIAGLQIKGDLHKQDVAVSTDIDFGGNDVIDSNGGDDIVVGGTGSDVIVTYGDERYSIDDNDVVYGDNAKLLFADRDNNPNTATTLTKAESIAATNLDATYDDAIRTGDGNDVVVGGIGSDAIFSGDVKNDDGTEETADRFEAVKDNDAEKNTDKVKLDNLDILSFNFTANNSGDEARVAHGVAAGVVVDDDWHDFYRNDRGVLMCDDTKAGWTQSMYEEEVNKIANNHAFNTFATVDGVNVDLYGRSVQNNNPLGLSAYTQENVAELDGDTANSKIFNSSLALHSQEEIILKLSGLNNYLADKESGETKGDQKTYDVYVYLGGDNDNSDTYNFVYDVYSDSYDGYTGEHRYVNDWVGHFFDGDYREAKCTDANKARVVAENGVTPRIEMIGNYVVFRGVTGDNFTVHIRNYHIPGTNQWPKNLPVITAVQIVTGKGRFELNEDGNPKTVNGEKVRANVAIGGDHDKDLVFGDDAYLEFDVDIPFGVGEHINDFQNRVVSANSMAIKHDDAVKVDTRDIIYTGKDRDVVVGGEDADTIKTGAADDVVVGDNANLMMEHNNPIGVFTPSNEITLDDHTIDTSTKEDYLGHDNVTVDTIQRKYDPNWGNQNNGYMGWGPNGWGWYSYNNNNARGSIEGIKEPVDTENTGRKDNIVDDEGSNLLIEGQTSSDALYDPSAFESHEDNDDLGDDDQPVDDNEQPVDDTQPEEELTQDDGVIKQYVLDKRDQGRDISIKAGETIMLVLTDWLKGNQWYQPNVLLKVDLLNGDNLTHTLMVNWNDHAEVVTITENWINVDIPDSANVDGEEKIVLLVTSPEDLNIKVTVTNS